MTPLLPAPDTIAVAGDWHGNTVHGEQAIQWAAIRGATVIVHVGDFGFWTPGPKTTRYLNRLEAALTEHGMRLFWVDGNHEDHDTLQKLPIAEHGLREIRPNIWHIPRGFRWDWHELTWMGVGGAASVDRHWRKPGTEWWPGEYITEDDVIHACRPGRVDVMVTHDVPLGVEVPSLRKAGGWPIQDLSRSDQNRDKLATIVHHVQPTSLFHGHYHCRYTGQLRHAGGVMVVEGLDMDGTPMKLNVLIVHLTIKGAGQIL